jgi:hypothetical protein
LRVASGRGPLNAVLMLPQYCCWLSYTQTFFNYLHPFVLTNVLLPTVPRYSVWDSRGRLTQQRILLIQGYPLFFFPQTTTVSEGFAFSMSLHLGLSDEVLPPPVEW